MATSLRAIIDLIPRLFAWMHGSAMDNLFIQSEDQDDANKQRHLNSMHDLLPANLSTEDFIEHLKKYPNYIRDVYQRAEQERFVDIPKRFEKRRAAPFLTKEELIYMDQWMQKRGTPLRKEAHIANAGKINQNKDETVRKYTADAFRRYRENKDINAAMEVLRNLDGVGHARASLLLSVAYPDTLPFFSRQLYQWFHWDDKTGWEQEFTWTKEKYDEILQQMKYFKERHSASGITVRAIDVEKVVFVLKHESIIRDLRVKKIDESIIDRSNVICDKGQAYVYKVPRKQLDGKQGSAAVKVIFKSPQVVNAMDSFLAEVSSSNLLAKKSPDHFVEFIGWNEDKHQLFIAMELIELGNLEQNLREGPWMERDIKETTQQLLDGLKAMHKHGIIHRDLKPRNVLVVCKSPGKVKVKITDFGTSKRLSDRGTTALVTMWVGTAGYKAPEVVKRWDAEKTGPANLDTRYSYTHKADLWSLGCIIFRMANEKPLFTSDGDVLDANVLRRQVGAIDRLLKKKLKAGGIDFVKRLIVINEKNRYDANKALAGLGNWICPNTR